MYNYKNRLSKELKELDATMILVSESLHERLETIDKLYILLEKDVDLFIMEKLLEVNEAYLKNGSIDFDLDDYKRFNEGFEMHVINEKLKIVNSTDVGKVETDTKIHEDISRFLSSGIGEEGYISERIKLSDEDLKVKKQGYYQTSDGKYILEGDYHMDQYGNLLGGDSFSSFTANAINMNESIMDVSLINVSVSNDGYVASGVMVDDVRTEAIDKAVQNGGYVAVKEHVSDGSKTYVYTPYIIKSTENKGEATEIVIELVYSDIYVRGIEASELRNEMKWIIFISVIVLFAYYLLEQRYLNPLEDLLHAFKRVERQEFDVQVDIPVNNEIKEAGDVFNQMVKSIDGLLKDKERESLNMVMTLAKSIDARDGYTGGHCERVMNYALMLANRLDLSDDDINNLKYASILHDVGKLGISDQILNKPGKLNEFERGEINKHPRIGYEILKDMDFLFEVNRVILHHHERYDGGGYPKGLIGSEIPYLAQIICVVDAFDAMITARPYRTAPMLVESAYKELKKYAGIQFNPFLVEVFIEAHRETEILEVKTVIERKNA